jgi:acyl-CoA synthetase (AMP-forming)/AMP-acid ligase II
MSDVNSIGEILVSGNHVVKFYLNSDLAFQKNKISLDGVLWHRTGDSGYYDDNGSLFLTGQPIQTLNNHVLFDIEKILVEIDGIDLGTIVGNKAYIQLSNNRFKSSVSQKLMELYPDLNAIQFLQLPLDRRHNGKIKYHLLKKTPIDD